MECGGLPDTIGAGWPPPWTAVVSPTRSGQAGHRFVVARFPDQIGARLPRLRLREQSSRTAKPKQSFRTPRVEKPQSWRTRRGGRYRATRRREQEGAGLTARATPAPAVGVSQYVCLHL